jgi:hypothetical protein
MILRVCAALLSCVLALACGCAQSNAAISAKPTTDELFRLKEKETPVQATVAVEDRNRQSTVRLVPDFKPPKLTAEEQAALGEPPLTFKFMPYPDRVPPTGSRVGPWWGGVVTDAGGRGGPSTYIDAPVSVSGAAGWGGVATEVDTFISGVTGLGYSRMPAGVAGPAGAIRVEADPTAATVARAKPHIEK